ncbi:UMP kinase [Microgenomates group bacterium RBG_16_45_19]|nr:MAG: UMP kinase [Microgenomates group bacterium RBG_16_45_19]
MAETPKYKRILLKIGGEALLGDREHGISPEACLNVANEIKAVFDLRVQIGLVIGAGNLWRGEPASKNGIDRATADYMGMLATVMNGLAMQDALEQVGIPTRVQTAIEMRAIAEPFIRRRALRHMEKGRLVILSAGVGSPYFTTDSGAALRALELNCEVLLKATKVDGVYDKDPLKFPDAHRFSTMKFVDAIKDPNINVMDTAALSLCMDNHIPIYVFNLAVPGNLKRAVMGEDIGTMVNDLA